MSGILCLGHPRALLSFRIQGQDYGYGLFLGLRV